MPLETKNLRAFESSSFAQGFQHKTNLSLKIQNEFLIDVLVGLKTYLQTYQRHEECFCSKLKPNVFKVFLKLV